MLIKFDPGRRLTCRPPALLPVSTVDYTSSHSNFSGSSSALSRETVKGSAPAVDQNGRHRALEQPVGRGGVAVEGDRCNSRRYCGLRAQSLEIVTSLLSTRRSYLVLDEIEIRPFANAIRKRIMMPPVEVDCISVNELLPPTATLMSLVYRKDQDEDGWAEGARGVGDGPSHLQPETEFSQP